MGLNYEQLDAETRRLMLEELELDVREGEIYRSQRLVQGKESEYLVLLSAAIVSENDDWLARQLVAHKILEEHELRRTPKGNVTVARVPSNAEQILAEGEFNRYYVRALCRRVEEMPGMVLEIYRAKEVDQPRNESALRVGHEVSSIVLLADLRTGTRVDAALGVPSGPNSGLTVRMRRREEGEIQPTQPIGHETAPNPPGTDYLPPPIQRGPGGG
ncbi:MAG: hypothetical protein ACJ8B6_06620 [Gemmatimonadales bacterium]